MIVKRAGLNEVIPGKLFQRANMHTWPAAQKIKLLNDFGIDIVVNVWNKIDPDLSGFVYLNWPLLSRNVPHVFPEFTKMLAQAMREEHRILVHCEAGRNRSVYVCALIVAEYKQISPGDALMFVLERVARGKVNDRLAANLHVVEESSGRQDGR